MWQGRSEGVMSILAVLGSTNQSVSKNNCRMGIVGVARIDGGVDNFLS